MCHRNSDLEILRRAKTAKVVLSFADPKLETVARRDAVKSICMIAAASIVALAVPALANSRTEVANAVAMVAVRGKAADGSPVNRTGTGFVVGNTRYVLTAKHVIAAPPGGWGSTDFNLPDVTIIVRLRDQQTGIMTEVRRANVYRAAADQDAALVEFDGLPRPGLSTCPAVDASTAGTQLNVVGVPNSAGADTPKLEFNFGVLNELQAQDGRMRRMSAQTKEGYSGAPVFLVEQQDLWRLVGLLKGGQSFGTSPQSIFTPVSEIRGTLLGQCPVACRDETHGVERYERDEIGQEHFSDWQRGGSTSESYCGSYRSSEMNAHPGVTVTIETHRDVDQRFFTGWRGNDYIVREAQYKYACQLRYRSGVVYKLALSARCPAPPNPDNLPK